MQDAALKLDQKDYPGARASAEEALKGNPEEVRALNVLVGTYTAQKQFPAGVQKAREYALRQPASASVQEYLGQLLTAAGDHAGARQAYEAAKAAKPGLLFADLALAEIDTNEGKGDEARKRLSAAASSHPRNVAGLGFRPTGTQGGEDHGGHRAIPQSVGSGRKEYLCVERPGIPAGGKRAAGRSHQIRPEGQGSGSGRRRSGRHPGMDLFPEGHVRAGGDAPGKRYRQRGYGPPEIPAWRWPTSKPAIRNGGARPSKRH